MLDLAAGKGVVTFFGGTGTLVEFEANADVSADADELWHWEGTFSFS